MTEKLSSFFVDSPLAVAAAESIRNGREIRIVITTATEAGEYVFTKKDGKNVILKQAAKSADMTFTIPEAALEDLVTQQFESVGKVGLFIFDKILTQNADHKIRVKLHCGVLSLIAGGYLGVLTAGGGDVAKFLATKGLGNLGKLKDAIGKMKE